MDSINIRNAKLEDAPRILEIYTYYVENTVITFEYEVPSLEEFENRMRNTMKKYPYLVIERNGKSKATPMQVPSLAAPPTTGPANSRSTWTITPKNVVSAENSTKPSPTA